MSPILVPLNLFVATYKCIVNAGPGMLPKVSIFLIWLIMENCMAFGSRFLDLLRHIEILSLLKSWVLGKNFCKKKMLFSFTWILKEKQNSKIINLLHAKSIKEEN